MGSKTDKELYAMPVDEVIAILKSSSDDRPALAPRRRRSRRRILADTAPNPDLIIRPAYEPR
jgi:hypothetical protein